MSISITLVLMIGLSVVVYFLVRPLQVFRKKEWFVSHSFLTIGLGLILGWLWVNRSQYEEITMLMGGIWTFAGGICFVAGYTLKRKKIS